MPAPVYTPPSLGVGMAWSAGGAAHPTLPLLEADLEETAHSPLPLPTGASLGASPGVLHCRHWPLVNRTEPAPPTVPWPGAAAIARAAWVSAPLAFSRVAGLGSGGGAVHTGALLPALQCAASVLVAVRRIEQLRRLSGRPVALRAIAHPLRPWPGELADGDYIAAVADAAGCGIDLDLGALRANERSGRAQVRQVLDRLPAHRVWSVRVALRVADGRVEPADLDVLVEGLNAWPQLGAVIVTDAGQDPRTAPARWPHTAELQALWSRRARRDPESPAPQRSPAFVDPLRQQGPRCSVDEWERALAGLANGLDPRLACRPAVSALAHEAGMAVLRDRVSAYRAAALQQGLPLSWRALVLTLGQARAEALRLAFWRQHWPAASALAEARHFAQFLREVPTLAQALAPHVHGLLNHELARTAPGPAGAGGRSADPERSDSDEAVQRLAARAQAAMPVWQVAA